MRSRCLTFLCGAVVLLATVPTQAHFLWVVTGSVETPVVQVYFGESAEPDDPDLLKRVAHSKAWAIPDRRGEPQPLVLENKDDSLVATLSQEQSHAPVALRCTYGTLTRGAETFLLEYYAKTYPDHLPGTWRTIGKQDVLPLEITPRLTGDEMALTVLWNGKVLPEAVVTVQGPGIDKKIEGTTDDTGVFRCKLPESGLFSIRAKHSETKSGEHEGTAYTSVRYYSTLSLRYQPAELTSIDHRLPALEKGVTSFGGAVLGDSLYVYGGHYGAAHHYSNEEQSGDFQRLNLRDPQRWESLPGGHKVTGLALVPYGAALYRVGGFTAKNSGNEDHDLWSQSDFARFDPQTNAWTALPALPEGRSSHDAAILGDRLYVVGGWNMRGDGKTDWHHSALRIDLSEETPAWEAITEPPFRRRAIALAAFNGRLYCLGGMQEAGGTTMAVAIFDPETNVWSEGPALLGSGMDAFGCSAFACGDRLYATTMSGSVQRLALDGKSWEFVGQLQSPRFFHRLLPWQESRLVVVGGASMSSGKIQTLELLPLSVAKSTAR